MDFDPRDIDSRDDERYGYDRERGGRDGSDHDRDGDDWRQLDPRDRDDDSRELGRGPGDDSRRSDSERGRDSREDDRWAERDRDPREREFDPRDVFTRHVHLPRGLEREIVRYRDRDYTLRGSESRTLSAPAESSARADNCSIESDGIGHAAEISMSRSTAFGSSRTAICCVLSSCT
jgi:hypothetical protein